MFVTMIGYGAGGLPSAVLMTVGMFLFAFACPILLHRPLQRVLESRGAAAHVLDGMAAVTVGIIAVTALQLLRTGVTSTFGGVIFLCTLNVLYTSTHPLTPVLIVGAAAAAGYVLFGSPAFAAPA